jgi:hypothetical protein
MRRLLTASVLVICSASLAGCGGGSVAGVAAPTSTAAPLTVDQRQVVDAYFSAFASGDPAEMRRGMIGSSEPASNAGAFASFVTVLAEVYDDAGQVAKDTRSAVGGFERLCYKGTCTTYSHFVLDKTTGKLTDFTSQRGANGPQSLSGRVSFGNPPPQQVKGATVKILGSLLRPDGAVGVVVELEFKLSAALASTEARRAAPAQTTTRKKRAPSGPLRTAYSASRGMHRMLPGPLRASSSHSSPSVTRKTSPSSWLCIGSV